MVHLANTHKVKTQAKSVAQNSVIFQTIPNPWYFAWIYYGFLGVSLPYILWRFSIINHDVWYGWFAFGAELFGILVTGLFLWVARSIQVPVFRQPDLNRKVDIFIPTFNEPLSILHDTIRAAKRVHGVSHVFVLDDSDRSEVSELALRLGADYFARPTHEHAKAGNMNYGLNRSEAEFIVCLDADHIPSPNFIMRTLGYFDDRQLAFVQTPQAFYNRHSFLFRRHGKKTWFEQSMFYDCLQLAKNRTNSAFFVGTSAIMRRKALDSIGGFATGTATEDIHTSLRLHAAGWNSLYIREPLAHGLEAENLKEFYCQRRRWAAGSLGLLLRSPDSPLWVPGLTLSQRLNYLHSTSHALQGFQKLTYFILPIICIISLKGPVTIGAGLYTAVLLAMALLSVLVTWIFARGTYHIVYSEAYNMANIMAHIAGSWGVVRVQKKFVVSKKSVGRAERTWVKDILWLMLAVSVVMSFYGAYLVVGGVVPFASPQFMLAFSSLVLIVINMGWLLVFFGYLLAYESRNDVIKPAPGLSVKPLQSPAFYELLPVRKKAFFAPSPTNEDKVLTAK